MINVIFKKKFKRNIYMALQRATYVSVSNEIFKRPNVKRLRALA